MVFSELVPIVQTVPSPCLSSFAGEGSRNDFNVATGGINKLILQR
jgi:hypothetical protein